jgi:hypothetical protein
VTSVFFISAPAFCRGLRENLPRKNTINFGQNRCQFLRRINNFSAVNLHVFAGPQPGRRASALCRRSSGHESESLVVVSDRSCRPQFDPSVFVAVANSFAVRFRSNANANVQTATDAVDETGAERAAARDYTEARTKNKFGRFAVRATARARSQPQFDPPSRTRRHRVASASAARSREQRRLDQFRRPDDRDEDQYEREPRAQAPQSTTSPPASATTNTVRRL